MDKVRSLEHYKEILSGAKENGCRLSNCFYLPDAVRRKTAEGTLLFQPIEHGLLLLEDQVDFYRCCYFLSEHEQPGHVTLDKDAVIEFPFNGTMNEKQRLQVQKIESMGFRLGRESGMMCSAPDQLAVFCAGEADNICRTAGPEDAAQILALINLYFDPLYAFLPTEEELLGFISEGRALVIRDGDGIAAALISSFEKRIASIRQVAVASAHRGKGLGKAIVQAYHSKYMGEAASFQHWVDLNNTPAVNMYLSFGYSFGLRKANEYILKEKQQ